MFEKPTTLILGAGVSVPYGLPTGPKLKNSILSGARAILNDRAPTLFGRVLDGRTTISDPYCGFWSHLKRSQTAAYVEPDVNLLRDFAKALEDTDQYTIDRFLRDNPRYAPLGRCFIVLELIRRMLEEHDDLGVRVKDFSRPAEGRWISGLINEMHELEPDNQIEQNRLHIVTFNYDPIVELVLNNKLCKPERFSLSSAKSSYAVTHVHGSFPAPQANTRDIGSLIQSSAASISLIGNDFKSAEASERIDVARQAISNAQQIFVAGFAFDDFNVQLLQLPELVDPRRIFCLNYDGNLGVSQRISKLGIPANNVLMGSTSHRIDFHDAIAQGFLEQRVRSPQVPIFL